MDIFEKNQHVDGKLTIEKSMIKYMKKNNNGFNRKLVKLLSKSSPNDSDLIDIVKEYCDYIIDSEEPGSITENKDQILKHKERVLHYQNGLFYLKEEDFKNPNKVV